MRAYSLQEEMKGRRRRKEEGVKVVEVVEQGVREGKGGISIYN